MYKRFVFLIALILLIGIGGICLAVSTSDSNYYPTYYPTFTVEPTQINGDSGWVSIDSNPQGATVYFDDSYEGITPINVRVMTSVSSLARIRVTKSGYQDWSTQLSRNPTPGETIYQYANLVAIEPTFTVEPTQIGGDSGWVSIDSNPQGATVYFDGSYEGITPTNVKVMSTANPSHSISLTKTGYQDWSSQLSRNPTPGETIYQYQYLSIVRDETHFL
ncbi:MAG: PEGA domain-containing protein [Methanobacteriota archaeon]